MNIERLKEIREDKDLLQQVQYSRYETGLRLIPIDKLAAFYNTSIDYLLSLTDERKAYPRKK